MATLYADENFPFQVVRGLREKGHDVLTTQEAGASGRAIPDEEVLAYAISSGRAVLTLNRRDFIALHRKTPMHCGIIVCTQDRDWQGQAKRIDRAIALMESLHGQLLRVHREPE